MEEHFSRQSQEYEGIGVGELLSVLREQWKKIALLSLAGGAVTFLLLLLKPNVYQASAVIAPPPSEERENPALGVLSSFGVDPRGATKLEDLESLFRSNDLTVRVFRKHNLWPILYGDRYDRATGRMKPGLLSRLFGGKDAEPPGDWDAIRAAEDRLRVSPNRRAGTLIVSFESPSATASADIVRYYVEEGKSRLQEEAFDRAVRNKKFIEEQIRKTPDALTRDRLYALFGREVEKEMMARNREQFGFRVIDSPRVPDRKVRPHRAKGMISAAALVFLASFGYFVFSARKKENA